MRTSQIFLGGLLLISGLASCNMSATDPVQAEADAYARNVADITSYASSKGLSVTTTASGLQYAITAPPSSTTARKATLGDEVEFSYVQYILQSPSSGTLVSDKLIDSTYATKSVYYPYFTNALIQGLEEGVGLLREGQKAILLMPARIAFGANGSSNGTIPGNTAVRFDVTLKRSRTEDQQINDYVTRNKLTVTETTSSGLRFIRTSAPTSATYASNATLAVRYNGRLLRSASAFDSTSGTTTRDFTLGQSIKGFDEGLSKMHVGEKATLLFPSTAGYGTAGVVSGGLYVIPPGSPLRFDVEVVSVR